MTSINLFLELFKNNKIQKFSPANLVNQLFQFVVECKKERIDTNS